MIDEAFVNDNYRADVDDVNASEYDQEIGLSKSAEGGKIPTDKEKAIAGLRRRRLANRSTTRKLKDEARGLFNVLVTCTMMLGSWTTEVMGDPMWEAWAVLQPRHHLRHPAEGVECLELFAGEARISEAFARRHRGVLEPRDLRYGHDLRTTGCQEEVIEDMVNYKPRLLWMAPPCTLWCKFSHLNYERQELRRLRQRERALVAFTSRAFELQTTLGGIAVIENPQGSDIWRHPLLQRFVGQTAIFSEVDMCTYGMKSLQDGAPLRKPLSLLTNNMVFAESMERKCEKGRHEHRRVQGKDTAWTAVYPTAFATAVVKACDVAQGSSPGVRVSYTTDLVQNEEGEGDKDDGGLREWEPETTGASAISFKGKVNPGVASALKRIHQNLGHPPNRDLIRHLRLANAPENVLRAAEQMVCRTCERTARPPSSRVSHPCVALDFNQMIAADVIWLDTVDVKNKPALNVVDLASTYQVVIPLSSTKSEEMGRALVDGWMSWAGAPKHLLVDLDSGFRDKFLQVMDSRSITVRCAAGQAHWQNGVCERHGATWKEIWKKLVDEVKVTSEEFAEAVACTSSAKNELRNKSGYSPRQWVFGTQARTTGDLFDSELAVEEFENVTADEKVSRAHAIRVGARAAFFLCQTKDALQRAAAHRTRVEKTTYEPGDLVYIYRELRQRKGKKSGPTWLGPGTIIGKEGHNFWVARGGRCLLAAPEHLRTAHHEEISEMMRLKTSLLELRRVMENADEDMVDENYPGQLPGDTPMEGDNPEDIEAALDMEVEQGGERITAAERRERRLEALARRRQSLDDVPYQFKKLRTQEQQEDEVLMVKHAISERGREKQLEKEIPWQLIPPEERDLYREAELKQWKEHVDYGAVRALSVEESQETMKRVDPSRILTSRYLYRDKNWSKRKADPSVPAKPKARLCIAGQNDPDLGKIFMFTDAPTTSRHSIILALQLSLCRGWRVSVGDIRAAFLNGIPAPRDLYFRQPKRGIPSLQQGQIVEVLKGVFGLSTSPKLWWMKLSGDLRGVRFVFDNLEYQILQNEIDPCVFQITQVGSGKIDGLLLTHVDDLMLMAPEELATHIQKTLKDMFPVDEWENDTFEYLGCEYHCATERIEIKQKNYISNRVEKMKLEPNIEGETLANPEQIEENRTIIGCLSWLAKQTRPDIQFQVCQAQRKQRQPTLNDLKQTNKMVDDAMKFKDNGVVLRKMKEDQICFLAYHDAAWGNTMPDEQEGGEEQWLGEHQVGLPTWNPHLHGGEELPSGRWRKVQHD